MELCRGLLGWKIQRVCIMVFICQLILVYSQIRRVLYPELYWMLSDEGFLLGELTAYLIRILCPDSRTVFTQHLVVEDIVKLYDGLLLF